MNFEEWYKTRTRRTSGGNDIFAITMWKNTASQGWEGCKEEVLTLFKHPKLNIKNNDLKYLLEEIENL